MSGGGGEAAEARRTEAPGRKRPWRAIWALGVTQIIGWGTTYSLPAVLVDPFSRSLAISPAFVFAGISVMMLVNAAVAPALGRQMDRIGARRVLVAGSCITAAGLVALASSRGPVTYLVAWMVLGVTMATALSTPAYAALVEIGGRAARTDIATLTLFTGFSSFLFWPITLQLGKYLDWREIILIYAVLHIAICLPLHAFALPRRGSSTGNDVPTAFVAPRMVLTEGQEAHAFWLVAAAFSAAGFVGWGLALQLPGLLRDLGMAPATAILIASCAGPVQVVARAIDMMFAGRYPALTVASGAVGLLSVAVIVLAATVALASGSATAALGALAFIALWGTANGLITVARAAVPLELFDPARFGTWMGRLAIYQNLSFAAAPVVLAYAIDHLGALIGLVLALMFALTALAAMIGLARLVAAAERSAT